MFPGVSDHSLPPCSLSETHLFSVLMSLLPDCSRSLPSLLTWCTFPGYVFGLYLNSDVKEHSYLPLEITNWDFQLLGLDARHLSKLMSGVLNFFHKGCPIYFFLLMFW